MEPVPVAAPPAALEGSPSKAPAAVPPPAEEEEDPFKDVPVLHGAKAELYLFDTEADLFVIQEKDVDADMGSNGDFDSELYQPAAFADLQPGLSSARAKRHSSRSPSTRRSTPASTSAATRSCSRSARLKACPA